MSALAHLIDHPDNPCPSGAEAGAIAAADGREIRWARFRPLGATVRGTVLVLQGRAEFIERWFETIRDLQVRGFHVVAFDWRGQGGSERLGRNPRMGHVGDFRAYDFDLDVILREIVAPLPGPLFVLAHSTGGLVAVANARRLAGCVRRVVLTAPFFGLGRHGVPAGLAPFLATLLRGLGLGGGFVPGGGATAILTSPFAKNRLTSDPVRLARGADLSWRHPEIAIGSPSIAWLGEALTTQKRIFHPDRLAEWTLPTLVFTSGAEEVVDNRAIERFVVATHASDLVAVPGARHELLQERDRYREQFWAAFDAFVPGSDVPRTEPPPVVAATAEPAVVAPPLPLEEDEETPPPRDEDEATRPLEGIGSEADAAASAARDEPAPSVGAGEQPQHDLVQARIAGGDDTAPVDGAAAGPGGDDPARPLDHGDQRDDVVGLEPGLDDDVGETRRDHAVGVAVDAVPREPHA